MSHGRPPGARSYEIERRLKALEGAELVVADETLSHAAAAKRVGSIRQAVSMAHFLLRHGNEAEKAALRAGEVPLRAVYDSVKERLTPEGMIPKKMGARTVGSIVRDRQIRAFEAARICIEQPRTSYDELAPKYNVSRRAISDAYFILSNGTPEQIEQAESGEYPILPIVAIVREATQQNAHAKTKPIGKNSATIHAAQVNVKLWERFRDALDAISSMPQPKDVVDLVRRHPRRTQTVNESLITAFSWITEFSDEWTKH